MEGRKTKNSRPINLHEERGHAATKVNINKLFSSGFRIEASSSARLSLKPQEIMPT